MMKKIAKISIMAAALMVLGGCGNNSESSESDKTLTVLVEGG